MRARLLGSMVVLLGCSSLSPRQSDPLDDSIRAYNDGVRWGRYEVAANFIAPKERAQFVDDADERSKDLRITQYDVVQVERSSGRAAAVHLKMEWYKESEGTVHETHAKQSWEKQGKAWLMVHETRVRGDAMPGLPEPVEPDSTDTVPDAGPRDSAAPGHSGDIKGG